MRKALRGIRLAAFGLAALLVSLVISRVLTVDPPRPQNNTILDEASGTQPNVPPPPAPPESKTVQPAKKAPAPLKVARPQAPLRTTQVVSRQPAPADAKAVVLIGDVQVSPAADAPAAPVTETASAQEPKGPVIVVAPTGKEGNRGVRVLKAVGHALGIGKPKDPAEEAFR